MMKEFWTICQFVFTAIGGWLGWFLGGCDGLLYTLLVFVTADYITGVLCAIIDKKLNSKEGFQGIHIWGSQSRRNLKTSWSSYIIAMRNRIGTISILSCISVPVGEILRAFFFGYSRRF